MKRSSHAHTSEKHNFSASTLRRMFGRAIPADLPLERDGSARAEAVMPYIERAYAAGMRTAIDEGLIVTAGTFEALRD
ncbi:hypothetical protein ACUXAV_004542 [Cupriavidus metallidurans]|uniref:hypothetical protein n=1 Tax=Cupriavidus metallidurans TaxID=119219 RepID=UPI000A5CDEDA|nr:hypothetical protein [Cupriavidus metallidurans]MDE4919571.1 hypothetical protein [Cupriavidus metallidurans]